MHCIMQSAARHTCKQLASAWHAAAWIVSIYTHRLAVCLEVWQLACLYTTFHSCFRLPAAAFSFLLDVVFFQCLNLMLMFYLFGWPDNGLPGNCWQTLLLAACWQQALAEACCCYGKRCVSWNMRDTYQRCSPSVAEQKHGYTL